jgi:hypothetical protein
MKQVMFSLHPEICVVIMYFFFVVLQCGKTEFLGLSPQVGTLYQPQMIGERMELW